MYYKIMIHLMNDDQFLDDNICVLIELPGIPRKGDTIYLTEEHERVLKDKAKSNMSILNNYRMWYFRNHESIEHFKEEHLKDFLFGEARYVDSIGFKANSDIIHVELRGPDGESDDKVW